jgi:hypothetical protein
MVVAPVLCHVRLCKLQLSLTLATIKGNHAVQELATTDAVSLAGHPKVGFTVSIISTLVLHVFELPFASIATKVTTLLPVLNNALVKLLIPLVGDVDIVAPVMEYVRETMVQLSVAMADKFAIVALQLEAVVACCTSLGQTIFGS